MSGLLRAREKLAYGCGDLGTSIAYTVVVFYFLFYLTDVVGLSPFLAGVAITVGRVWDAVSDPLAGHLSDHTRSQLGRRKPYLLLAAVPFGLSFALLWSVPSLSGPALTALWAGAAFLIHTTLFTLVGVPYGALTAELTPDYDERTSLSAYRMAFSIAGGLVAAVVPMAVVAASPTAAQGFGVMGIGLGAVCALTPLVVVFGCRTPPVAATRGPRLPLGVSTRITLSNGPFRRVLTLYLLTWAGIDILSVVFVYYLTYWMGMEADIPGILGTMFVTAVLFLPVWVRFSAATSKRLAYVAGLGFLAAVLLAACFLGPGQRLASYALAFLAGIGVSAAHVVPWSMVPDCVELDELRTGRRREGAYYGLLTFLQKLASSGAVLAVGVALQLTGYVPGAVQPPSALLAMRVLLGPVPGLLFVLGMAALAGYGIDRAEHARLRAAIAARREGEVG